MAFQPLGPSPPNGGAPARREILDKRKDPVFQSRFLVVANIVILIVVWQLLDHGYPTSRDVPRLFLWLELAVIVVGGFSSFTELIGQGLAWVGSGEWKPSAPMAYWLSIRPRAQRLIVYGLSVLVWLALSSLVVDTGLGIESPFVPLAAAPAVFGPFVATERRAVVGLVIVVSLTLGYIAWHVSTKVCPSDPCGEVRAHELQPSPKVFFGVTVMLLVIAGFISAARLQRERTLVQDNAQLHEDNHALRAALEEFGRGPTDSPD